MNDLRHRIDHLERHRDERRRVVGHRGEGARGDDIRVSDGLELVGAVFVGEAVEGLEDVREQGEDLRVR